MHTIYEKKNPSLQCREILGQKKMGCEADSKKKKIKMSQKTNKHRFD